MQRAELIMVVLDTSSWVPWETPPMLLTHVCMFGSWKNSRRIPWMDGCHGLFHRWVFGDPKPRCSSWMPVEVWRTAEGPGQCSRPAHPASHCCPPRSPGAAVFAGALIYAIHPEEILEKYPRGGSFGYCFALAWVAFPLALVSGIIYIHLRKRE